MGALRVITLNMHKGLSPLKVDSTVYRLRQKLRSHHPDLIFIQELQQENVQRQRRFASWPRHEITHFLADGIYPDWHYGKNAEYRHGHHGNAILSKFPLHKGINYDISEYRFERRGLLHSTIELEGQKTIHCFCVHLALLQRGRERQLTTILHHIEHLSGNHPTIIAGDFNDWRNTNSKPMGQAGFVDVFESLYGAPARTFPSIRPILPMDRIYVRGLVIQKAEILTEWAKLSDHLAIYAELGH
jgi:endonuclease/exonuclease/phosphatase family metal-dependent hydrolase